MTSTQSLLASPDLSPLLEPSKLKKRLESLTPEERVALQKALTPRLNEFIPVNPHTKQVIFLLLNDVFEVLFGGAAGPGKLLETLTVIPTPEGFIPIKDIHPGDQIFGRDGLPYTVLAESEIVTESGWRFIFDDGSEVVSHDNHLWLTLNAVELEQLSRRTTGFREQRRDRRPSRAQTITGSKHHSEDHRRALAASRIEWNRQNPPPVLPPPEGTVRTTQQIVDTLTARNGRANHAIPVTAPLQLPQRELLIDPYLLGCWLGDGSTNSGHVTSMDEEILDAFREQYSQGAITTKKDNKASTVNFYGLIADLREVEVLGHKHIPHDYLWASEQQRRDLLAGLLDTDGGWTNGSVEFTSTNLSLAEGVAFLIRSLGMKARIAEGRATLYGVDKGPKWRITFTPDQHVFRLTRKRSATKLSTRRTTRFRYIKAVERVENLEMKCLRVSSPDSLFLCTENLIPTHNSIGLLIAAAQYIDIPGYSALLLRRSFRDLALPGALMHLSHQWWDHTAASWDGTSYKWTFPSGAVIQFGYLEHDGDELRYQSSAYQFVGFDELTQFKEHQYTWMFSRIRKAKDSQIPLRMRSATNPGGPGHEWVKERWNLPSGDTGTPNRVFVPALLDDNPFLDIESYELGLGQLADVTFQQLRSGDWDATISGGKFYPQWFTIIDKQDIPKREHWEQIVRHWDLGSQAVTSESPDPDWTAGCKMIKVRRLPTREYEWYQDTGNPIPPPPYYIVAHVNRFRLDPGGVEEEIANSSAGDGFWVPVSIEQERGASGKGLIASYRKHVLPQSERVVGLWAKEGKDARARIAAGRSKEGRVFVVNGPWTSPFINELSLFGVDGVHDDQVDAFSGCFKAFEKLAFMTGEQQGRQY